MCFLWKWIELLTPSTTAAPYGKHTYGIQTMAQETKSPERASSLSQFNQQPKSHLIPGYLVFPGNVPKVMLQYTKTTISRYNWHNASTFAMPGMKWPFSEWCHSLGNTTKRKQVTQKNSSLFSSNGSFAQLIIQPGLLGLDENVYDVQTTPAGTLEHNTLSGDSKSLGCLTAENVRHTGPSTMKFHMTD